MVSSSLHRLPFFDDGELTVFFLFAGEREGESDGNNVRFLDFGVDGFRDVDGCWELIIVGDEGGDLCGWYWVCFEIYGGDVRDDEWENWDSWVLFEYDGGDKIGVDHGGDGNCGGLSFFWGDENEVPE